MNREIIARFILATGLELAGCQAPAPVDYSRLAREVVSAEATATAIAANMTSEGYIAAGTPTPETIMLPVETTNDLESMASNGELAASLYGASAYSKNPSNWDILSFDNGNSIGAHLTPNSNGEHVRINTSGAAVEGYWDIKQVPGEVPFFEKDMRAMTFVVDGNNVPQIDVRGNTAWQVGGEDTDVTTARLWRQVTDKEKVEQPGTIVVPVGFCPQEDTRRKFTKITTAQEAASIFGNDEYSKNPSNWDILSFDNGNSIGAHLTPNSQGDHTRVRNLNGTVFEGYLDIKDDDEVPFFDKGVRAETFVGNGSAVPTVDVRGLTVWIVDVNGQPEDNTKSLQRLWGQVTEKEEIEQPGVLVLPFGFKPINPGC